MSRTVLVIGGGPAGLCAAIEARLRGLEVTLVEPREGVIDKACGEGLMPAAVERLVALGVPELNGRPFVGIRYRDSEDPELTADGDFPQPGLGVRRTVLHRALLERARETGVAIVNDRVQSVQNDPDRVAVTTREHGEIHGDYVLAADGLHSPTRREMGLEAPSKRNQRFGVRRHYRMPPWSNRVEVFWHDHAEAYVTPVDDDLVGVAILFEPKARFDELLGHFPVLAAKIDGHETASETRGAGPFEQRVTSPRKGRVLLIGDAAGYLDPLTGEGVALAAATAHAAIESICADGGRSYEKRYRDATRAYFVMTAALLDSTRPRWVHRPLIRILNWSPFVFDKALGVLGT